MKHNFPNASPGLTASSSPPSAANAFSLRPPRWLHDRILFELEESGATLACSVSKAAIQDAGGRYSKVPRDIMSEFFRLRGRIEQAAVAKFRNRDEGLDGTVHVWSADLDENPDPPTTVVQAVRQG